MNLDKKAYIDRLSQLPILDLSVKSIVLLINHYCIHGSHILHMVSLTGKGGITF